MKPLVADLHIHTNQSDGYYSYEYLGEKCKKLGYEYIAITDHDILVDKKLCNYFAKNGPNLIRGSELSAYIKDTKGQYKKLDMLLYNYSLKNIFFFEDLMRRKAELRINWIQGFLKEITEKYPKFSTQALFDFFSLKGISEVHEGLIFGTLKRLNLLPTSNFELSEFYNIFMAKEFSNPDFINTKILLDELIEIRNKLGGVFSMAHPLYFFDMEGFLDIIPIILAADVRFIEAYHFKHTAAQTNYLLNFANNNNLGITGGSDFHGRTATTLGKHGLTKAELDKFLDSINKYASREEEII